MISPHHVKTIVVRRILDQHRKIAHQDHLQSDGDYQSNWKPQGGSAMHYAAARRWPRLPRRYSTTASKRTLTSQKTSVTSSRNWSETRTRISSGAAVRDFRAAALSIKPPRLLYAWTRIRLKTSSIGLPGVRFCCKLSK